MALATIAEIAAIAAAAVSVAGTAYSASQPGPHTPNLSSSSRQVAQAMANQLPVQRALAVAEQSGGTYTMHVPTHVETKQTVRIITGELNPEQRSILAGNFGNIHQALIDAGTLGIWGLAGGGSHEEHTDIAYNPADWKPGGKNNPNGEFSQAWVDSHLHSHDVVVNAHDEPYDFKGFGTADVEGQLAKQMEDLKLKLGEKYGTQFVEEARREAEQADPLGFAARDKEAQMIKDEAQNPMPINPLAPALEGAIDSQLKAGSGLDAESSDLLDSAVARANAARGGATTAGQVAGSMSTGNEGQQRLQAGETKAQAFLGSGSTPEDIAYRREQELLGNEGAFIAGQTPQSQFRNLSGASQGATPFYGGQTLPGQATGAGGAGGSYGVSAYQAQVNAMRGQANPWMAGISSLLNGLSAAGAAAG